MAAADRDPVHRSACCATARWCGPAAARRRRRCCSPTACWPARRARLAGAVRAWRPCRRLTPIARRAIAGAAARPATSAGSGWGGGPACPPTWSRADGVDELRAAVRAPPASRGVIARGMGRSYGDAAQLRDGLVLDTTAPAAFELDAARAPSPPGAGCTLGELLAALAPAGWMLPVVPGTQHVTVGGAIASDIHGKNHGVGRDVRQPRRGARAADRRPASCCELTPDRGRPSCSARRSAGMGLTGVIVWARIELRRCRSAPLCGRHRPGADARRRARGAAGAGGPHRVAWLDLLGPTPVRGVVTRAEHCVEPRRRRPTCGSTVPARADGAARGWPGGLLRPARCGPSTSYRFRRAPRRRERAGSSRSASHMFPLDGLDRWPRLYGRAASSSTSWWCRAARERVLESVIERLRRSPVPCYLAVLKDFGPASERAAVVPDRGLDAGARPAARGARARARC